MHPPPPETGTQDPPARTRFLAWLGLAAVAEFVVAVLALHAASLSSEPWHMSEFAHSRLWWLWVASAYSFTVGGMALSLALKPYLPLHRSPLARAALALLGVSTLATLVVASFPVDTAGHSSTAGLIHNDAALSAFGSIGACMLLVVPDLRSRPAWRAFADASLVLGLLVAAGAVAYVLADMHQMSVVAVVQRILVGLIAAWFLALALQLLRLARPAAPATTSP